MDIEEGEVVGDDRDGKRHENDATDGTQHSNDATQRRLRIHVTVTNRRHGDDAPPEPDGNVREHDFFMGHCERVGTFGVEDDGGEDEHPDEEEDRQHQQLVDARPDRMHQDLERAIVLQNVEDTEYANDAQDEDGFDEGAVGSKTTETVGELEEVLDVERQQRQDVNDVRGTGEELGLVGGEEDANDELETEEGGADVVQDAQEGNGFL